MPHTKISGSRTLTTVRRLAVTVASLAALGASVASCAADDYSQPLPDDTISSDEIASGTQAIAAMSSDPNAPNPAFDNGEPTDETDGQTAGLAPEQPEPSEAQQAADQALIALPDDGVGEQIDTRLVLHNAEDEGELASQNAPPAPSSDSNTSTTVEALRACRAATGYVSGRAFRICVTTVNGKLIGVRTARAFVRMRAAARRAGVRLVVVSGFRTMAQQRYLYRLYLSGRGNLAARPGYSNHQSGIALDLNTSAAGVYRWLARNGHRFGFRRTVPSEAWHWEYRP